MASFAKVTVVVLAAVAATACGGQVEGVTTSADAGVVIAPPIGDAGGPSFGFDASIRPPPPFLDGSLLFPDARGFDHFLPKPDIFVPPPPPPPPPPKDAGMDSFISVGADGGWVSAPHYPMPTVTDYDGPTITSPVFTAITFPGYDLTMEAQAFVGGIGASTYWSEVTAEYGVGATTAATPVLLTETAPTSIDDSDVQVWLAGKLDGTNAAFGTPTDQSVYVIFYPTGTVVTLQGLQSCVAGGFGGYHNSVALTSGPWANLNVAYAVLPECAITANTAVTLTQSGSHELVEAVTDPLPLTQMPAYATTDENDIIWDVILGGGEVADMCAQNLSPFFTPAGYPYSVQRIWSNQAAMASHDPCQPSPAGVAYFNSVPTMNAQVNITDDGQTVPTEGLLIPMGKSQTVEVDLFSDGPTEDWTVSASDFSDDLGGGPYLDFAWDATQGNNGTKLHLTITPLAATMFGGEPFIILSTSSAVTNYWIGYVGQ